MPIPEHMKTDVDVIREEALSDLAAYLHQYRVAPEGTRGAVPVLVRTIIEDTRRASLELCRAVTARPEMPNGGILLSTFANGDKLVFRAASNYVSAPTGLPMLLSVHREDAEGKVLCSGSYELEPASGFVPFKASADPTQPH